MAFFPDVRKGEKFKPSALMYNNVARQLNQIDGFKSNGISKISDGSIRIAVLNTSSEVLQAQSAVSIVNSSMGDAPETKPVHQPAYKIDKYGVNSEISNWCVLEETLNPGEIGSAILTGIVEVKISEYSVDTDNGFVFPNADDPSLFDVVEYETPARVLRVNGNDSEGFLTADVALIPLAGGGGHEYNGFFKLSLQPAEGGYRVKIADGAYGGMSEARVNNRKFNIPPYTSRTFHIPNNIFDDFEVVYFYLYFDPDKMTSTNDEILTIKETDYSPSSDRSILLGRLYYDYEAGKLRVIQDSYGTPFLPYFYSCEATL